MGEIADDMIDNQMTPQQIDTVVCEIMAKDGPDGHVDGHEKISEFICALLKGEGKKWSAEYLFKEEG